MNEFHFLRPWWLLVLVPLALLLIDRHRRPRAGNQWQEWCDPRLLPHILVGKPGRAARHLLVLAGISATLAILALAGPAWERLPAPAFRNLSALVVVLDLSYAMDAADFKPNRLDRVRYTIGDILRERKDGQSALVVYAGDAFTVTPLTDDAATITAQLSALSPNLMPVQGSRIDLGLEAAGRLLRQAGLKSGDILLVSSGEGAERAAGPVGDLTREGFRVSVLGAGTPDGAPVPLGEGGFLKDQRGNIVVPRMDEAILKRLAQSGGGVYRTLGNAGGDPHGLARLFASRADVTGGTGATLHVEQWREAGIWLLPLLLPLGALLFRRGWVAVFACLAFLPSPRPAQALTLNDWFTTPDQRAEQSLRAGKPDDAARQFQNPQWKAAAEYQAGRYDEAASVWRGMDTAAAHYNRGNALAKQGRYAEALEDYRRALELNQGTAGSNPADPKLAEDAQYNRDLVQKALEQQKKQQQQQQSNKSGDQSQKDKSKDGKGDGKKDEGQQSQGDQSSEGQQQSGENQQDSGQGQNDRQANGQKDSSQAQTDQKDGKEQDKPSEQQASANDAKDKQDNKPPADQTIQPEAGEEPKKGKDEPKAASAAERDAKDSKQSEDRQAEAHWLRRIPDDPGGLLKRKFDYQYRQRQRAQAAEQRPW